MCRVVPCKCLAGLIRRIMDCNSLNTGGAGGILMKNLFIDSIPCVAREIVDNHEIEPRARDFA
jgi:hypothetical protein